MFKDSSLRVSLRGNSFESDRLDLKLFVGRRTGNMNAEDIGKLTDPRTKSCPLVSSLFVNAPKTFSLYPGEDDDEESAKIVISASRRVYKKMLSCEVLSTSWIVPDSEDDDANDFTAKLELRERNVTIAESNRGRLANIYVDSLDELALKVEIGVSDAERKNHSAYGFVVNSKCLSEITNSSKVEEIQLDVSSDSFAKVGDSKIAIESLGHRSRSNPRKFESLAQFVTKWYMFKPKEVKSNWNECFCTSTSTSSNKNVLKNTKLVSTAQIRRRFPSLVVPDAYVLAARVDDRTHTITEVLSLEDHPDEIKDFVLRYAYNNDQKMDEDEDADIIDMFTKKSVSSASESAILSNVRKHFIKPSITLRVQTKPYVPETERNKSGTIAQCLKSCLRAILDLGQCGLCAAICLGFLALILIPLYLHARDPSVEVHLVYEFEKPVLTAKANGGHLDLDGIVRYSIRNDGWIPVCLDEVKAKMFYVKSCGKDYCLRKNLNMDAYDIHLGQDDYVDGNCMYRDDSKEFEVSFHVDMDLDEDYTKMLWKDCVGDSMFSVHFDGEITFDDSDSEISWLPYLGSLEPFNTSSSEAVPCLQSASLHQMSDSFFLRDQLAQNGPDESWHLSQEERSKFENAHDEMIVRLSREIREEAKQAEESEDRKFLNWITQADPKRVSTSISGDRISMNMLRRNKE